MSNVDEALEWADICKAHGMDLKLSQGIILAAEVRRLRDERARLLDEAEERAIRWIHGLSVNLSFPGLGDITYKLDKMDTTEFRAAVRGEGEK